MPEGALINQVYVFLDGQDLPDPLLADLLNVTVENSVHLPSVASIEFHDPHLQWVDDSSIEPGHVLTVSAKADQSEKPLFDGEIVEIEPDFSETTHRLTIRAFDRMHRLSRGTFARSFKDMSDADIIKKVAAEAGLSAEIEVDGPTHRYVLQANETNLDFIRRRAAALGCLIFVEKKTLYCQHNRLRNSTVHLRWGQSLLEFRPRMSTVQQVSDVIVRGWDINRCRTIIGSARNGDSPPKIGEATPGGDYSVNAFRLDHTHLITDTPIRSQAAADSLAKSVANNYTGRFIQAEGVCTGDPTIVAGAAISVETLGKKFSGTYLVTEARHTFEPDRGYLTSFGVTAYNTADLLDFVSPPTNREPIAGLAVAVVTDNNDPDGWGRVKVRFPWLSDEYSSYWARVSIVGGGRERGIEFLPEIDDEVLVGFEMGDPEVPYIVGGLWNGRDSPPKKTADVLSGHDVKQRLIRSRTGQLIILDDSSDNGGITIQDRNNNTIVLTCKDDKLTITAKGDIVIRSSNGSLTLQADKGVSIHGGPSVNIDADQISLKN